MFGCMVQGSLGRLYYSHTSSKHQKRYHVCQGKKVIWVICIEDHEKL